MPELSAVFIDERLKKLLPLLVCKGLGLEYQLVSQHHHAQQGALAAVLGVDGLVRQVIRRVVTEGPVQSNQKVLSCGKVWEWSVWLRTIEGLGHEIKAGLAGCQADSQGDQKLVQVVDALEVVLHLRVVVPDHLDQFLACFLHIAAFELDLELPRPLLEPQVERTAAFRVKVCLRFCKIFLSNQELEEKFAEVLRDRGFYLVQLLVIGHVAFGKGDCELQRDRVARAAKPGLRVHIKELDVWKRKGRLIKLLDHLLCHLGCSPELAIHQRARVKRVSELLVLRVLAMKDLYHFKVLLLVESALLHAGCRFEERVKHIVVHCGDLLDLFQHAQNLRAGLCNAI